MRAKLRINYYAKKPIWDGNYYFGLTEEQYNSIIPPKKGRYKNKITFPTMKAYKIKEEASVFYANKYIYKLTGEEDRGISFTEENYSTRNIELIAIRNKNGKIEEING